MLLLLAGCTVGPDYVRPPTAAPEAYKENAGWKVAQPRDELPRGAWWEIYHDPQLNALEAQVDITNQNIAAAEANFRQALALIRVARAAYFPTVTGGPSWSRFKRSENLGSSNRNLAGASGTGPSGGSISTFPGATLSDYLLNFNAAWELDIWGKVRRSVESSQASAQAIAANLEVVRLSAQATLAQSYFLLRALDEQKRLLDDIAGLQKNPRSDQKPLRQRRRLPERRGPGRNPAQEHPGPGHRPRRAAGPTGARHRHPHGQAALHLLHSGRRRWP